MSKPSTVRPRGQRQTDSGEPKSHPLGVGLGSAGGAVAGAAVGAVGGPAGIAVGAAVGGLVGGLTGKGMAEAINPSLEDSYWRENFSSRPYAKPGTAYETYLPAYRYGWESRGRYGELNWEGAEPQLREQWSRDRGDSELTWDEARPAARDAWERIGPGVDYRAENR